MTKRTTPMTRADIDIDPDNTTAPVGYCCGKCDPFAGGMTYEWDKKGDLHYFDRDGFLFLTTTSDAYHWYDVNGNIDGIEKR